MNRFAADFLMGSRLPEYRTLLLSARERGYQVMSVAEHAKSLSRVGQPDDRRIVLRHDIDTDVATAKEMWRLCRETGCHATFYFRTSTIDIEFMKQIEREGGEASYHFEELSTQIKRRAAKTEQAINDCMAPARALFLKQLIELRRRTGCAMTTVASHGDFANRATRRPNWLILQDHAFRKELGVEWEVYDASLNVGITSRFSDCIDPPKWKGGQPLAAVERGDAFVYILVHPRHWRAAALENAIDNVNRAYEGVLYNLALPLRYEVHRYEA